MDAGAAPGRLWTAGPQQRERSGRPREPVGGLTHGEGDRQRQAAEEARDRQEEMEEYLEEMRERRRRNQRDNGNMDGEKMRR